MKYLLGLSVALNLILIGLVIQQRTEIELYDRLLEEVLFGPCEGGEEDGPVRE